MAATAKSDWIRPLRTSKVISVNARMGRTMKIFRKAIDVARAAVRRASRLQLLAGAGVNLSGLALLAGRALHLAA